MAGEKDQNAKSNELSRACLEISKINFSGNIIPKNWFRSIKFSSGKADLLAINILSEIVYWYRLEQVCDEATGKVIGYKQRFKADRLQRSYQSFADMFGVSKLQVKRAMDRLKGKELVKTEFRTIKTNDACINNVCFIEPVPANIKDITHQVDPSLLQSKEGVTLKLTPPYFKRRTYTKTTNKITTKNTNTTSSEEEGSSPPSPTQKLPYSKLDSSQRENITVLNEEDKHPDGVSKINDVSPANEHDYPQPEVSPQEIIESWNSICGLAGLPKVIRLTKQRSGNISRRIREYGGDPVFWEGLFRRIIQTPFLMGNNDRGWRADIDFVFGNDTNISKILEGKYERGSQKKNTGLTGQIQGVFNAMEKIKQRNEERRVAE